MKTACYVVAAVLLSASLFASMTVWAQADADSGGDETQPTSGELYRRGVNQYEHGDYAEAAETFKSILEPLTLYDPELIKKARVYRGICMYLLDDKVVSENEFFQVMLLDPEYELDPLFTPPNIIEFFERIRKKRADDLAKLNDSNGKNGKNGDFNIRTGRQNPNDGVNVRASGEFLLTLAPFGVGQLNNKQPLKGYLLLGSEVALLVTNVATYAALRSLERTDDNTGGTGFEDPVLANTLRILNVTSGGVFIALVVYGLLDALWYRYAAAPPTVPPDVVPSRPRPKVSFSVVPVPALTDTELRAPERRGTRFGVSLEFRF